MSALIADMALKSADADARLARFNEKLQHLLRQHGLLRRRLVEALGCAPADLPRISKLLSGVTLRCEAPHTSPEGLVYGIDVPYDTAEAMRDAVVTLLALADRVETLLSEVSL